MACLAGARGSLITDKGPGRAMCGQERPSSSSDQRDERQAPKRWLSNSWSPAVAVRIVRTLREGEGETAVHQIEAANDSIIVGGRRCHVTSLIS